MALNEFGAGFKIWAKDFASGVFGDVGKNFSDMTKQAENDASRMSAGLARIGKGVALMGVGFAIVKPMEIAVRESSRLNKALAEVATLTDEATFPMSKMKELVKGTAEQFGDDAVMQTKALYQTISAGYGEAEQAAKMLETANKLSVGGVTEVSTAIDGLTNIMNAYKSSNLESLDVSDAMFVAMKEGKTTIGELSSYLGNVAPQADAMGIKFDELLATISSVTSVGISTSQAVSGMAAALGNLSKPTADATKEAKRLGIAFDAKTLRELGLKKFLDSITSSAKFNEDSISKLFGSIEAFKTMTALTANESAKFNDVMEKMESRIGATDVAVSKMEDSFEHQAKRFRSIRQNILGSIGDTFEGMFAPILKLMNRTGIAIRGFIDSLPSSVKKTIASLVGGFGAFIGLAGGIMVLSGAMNVLGISIKGAVFGFLKMSAVMIPVTILMAGMGVSVYALYRAFKKNTGGIEFDWKNMTKRVGIAWEGMMSIISGNKFSDELNEQLSNADNVGVKRFLSGFKVFSDRVSALWDGIITGFDRGVEKLSSSSGMMKLKSSIEGITSMFSSAGAADDIDILKRWENQGEATGEKLASFGEVAFQAASNVLYLTKQFMGFVSNVDVEKLKMSIDGLIVTFDSMKFTLGKVGEFLQMIWKMVASAVSGVQIFGAALSEVMAMIISGDFSQGMTATKKQVEDFDKIWNPEKYPEMRGAMVGLPEMEMGAGVKLAGVGAQNMEYRNLKDRQQQLIKFVEKGEKMTRGGREVEFQDLSKRDQDKVVKAIEDLSQRIERMANRPVNVEIDGEQVAKSVRNSDDANGVREFSPSFGY